jgi:CheY-like chemotaxis protein
LQLPVKTILIVDDIVDDLLMFEDVIEELGHHPLLALTPADAKDYLKRSHPDLIVWNTDIPKSWEELKDLFKNKPVREVPVIAIVSATSEKAAETALKLGCIGLMRKPVGEGIIAEVLEQGLRPEKRKTGPPRPRRGTTHQR